MGGDQLFDLTGRSGIVTGAASGLGLAIAEALAEHGAQVLLTDVDATALGNAVVGLEERNLACRGAVIDATDAKRLGGAMAVTAELTGRLDIVFANAGISAGPGPYTDAGAIEAVSAERWSEVLDVNLNAVFSTLQLAAGIMKPQRSGTIIVTASTAAYRADPMVGYAYSATKAAVANLVRQAAIDLARFNIRVNAIAPGPFRTNIGGGRMRLEKTERDFSDSLPLGRIGEPKEIKGAAVLLASDASSFMTGTTIFVDGGASAW